MGCPSGMHTNICMYHSLLHPMDTNPDNRQRFKGSCLLVPHGTQYKTLFPVLAEPCNHHGPLVDPNTGKSYPMEAAGNFCLEDAFFQGCPGDSLIFHHNDLTKVVRLGFHIPAYREKAMGSTSSAKLHRSPHTKESMQKPPCKEEESSKPSGKTSRTCSPQIPNSMSSSKTSHKSKHSPTAKEWREKYDHKKHLPPTKEQKDKHDHEDCNTSTKPREWAHP